MGSHRDPSLDVDLAKMIRQSLWLVAVAVVFTLAIADSRSQNDDNLNTQQLVQDILKTRSLRKAKERNKGQNKGTKSRSKKKLKTLKKKKKNRPRKKGKKERQRKIKERKKEKNVDGRKKKN